MDGLMLTPEKAARSRKARIAAASANAARLNVSGEYVTRTEIAARLGITRQSAAQRVARARATHGRMLTWETLA